MASQNSLLLLQCRVHAPGARALPGRGRRRGRRARGRPRLLTRAHTSRVYRAFDAHTPRSLERWYCKHKDMRRQVSQSGPRWGGILTKCWKWRYRLLKSSKFSSMISETVILENIFKQLATDKDRDVKMVVQGKTIKFQPIRAVGGELRVLVVRITSDCRFGCLLIFGIQLKLSVSSNFFSTFCFGVRRPVSYRPQWLMEQFNFQY